MSRKATFSHKRPKPNSSAHNSRKEIPNYLIETDPDFSGNYYERISPFESDEQFVELAKKIYNEKFIERTGQNQKMQKKQAEALLWEVAISVEKHHTKEDVLALFKMLRKEKRSTNYLKMERIKDFLKPVPKDRKYTLPEELKIKRKPKKENLNETGFHILELAGHYDEGHFIRKGKWEDLAYYPGTDILLKDDGHWYIKSDELNEDTSTESFDVKVDMSEFEKVYNYHWHVKYTNFNMQTGLSANFSKGEVSGEGRLKKVAEFLGMKYVPKEKVPFAQSVKTVKEQHHIDRQNKYVQLMMKFGYKLEMELTLAKIEKREYVLAEKNTNSRINQKKNSQLEADIGKVNELLEEEKEKNSLLEKELEENKQLIVGKEEELKSIQMQVPGETEVVISQKTYDLVQRLKETFDIENDEDLYDAIVQQNNRDQERIHNLESQIEEQNKLLEKEKESNEIQQLSMQQKNNELSEQLEQAEEQTLLKAVEVENLMQQLPKEKEVIISKETYQELKNIQIQISEYEAEIVSLKEQVYSDQNIFRDGKDTGEKFTFKKLSEVRKRKIKEFKEDIEELRQRENILKQEVDKLERIAYTGNEIPNKYDDEGIPVSFEKETWEDRALSYLNEIDKLQMEIEYLHGEIEELRELAYFEFTGYDSELGEVYDVREPYKEISQKLQQEIKELKEKTENNTKANLGLLNKDTLEYSKDLRQKISQLEKMVKDAEEIIGVIKDHNVPKEALEGTIDEIKEKVLEKIWSKKNISSQKKRAFKIL